MKVALVTGGSRGIGRAVCVKLAAEGYHVLVNYVSNDAAAKETLAQMQQAADARDVSGGSPAGELLKFDVADYEATAKAIGDWQNDNPGEYISVLVNNAGITKDKLLARMSEDEYDAVIAVNQKSVYNMTKHVTAVMMKQRHGRIVNVASVAGLYGNPGQMNYSASKAAVIGMTKTVAKEFGSRNITCNAVAPGLIRTPMTDVLSDELKEKMIEAVALRRYGEPEEIASVVSFLVSDDASYVTGQVIEISGGLSM